jgi:hypothetical protein
MSSRKLWEKKNADPGANEEQMLTAGNSVVPTTGSLNSEVEKKDAMERYALLLFGATIALR